MKKIIVMSVLAVLATGASVDVLVLNTTASVVVRDDIVVPSGLMLTLGAGCIVKFTDGARIVVESGGAVVAEGACPHAPRRRRRRHRYAKSPCWRKGGDSNPRWSCPHTTFPRLHHRPLGHPSMW